MLAARAAKEDGISMTEAYRRLGYKKDRRSYLPVANILCDLGVRSIRLLSNNPDKVRELSEHGVAVLGMQPVLLDPEKHPGVRRSYADKAAQGHVTQIPGKMQE
jgi:3,4-dihydroxy 2-butanone 4-phosphate synthase/GTP cyclohydrolase II